MLTQNMPNEIKTFLESCPSFSDIKFVLEYPAAKKESPLKKTTVSIGLNALKTDNTFLGNVCGLNNGNPVLGKTAEIDIGFSIYVPHGQNGFDCHFILKSILEQLSLYSDFNILESNSGKITDNNTIGAYSLDSFIKIKAIVEEEV